MTDTCASFIYQEHVVRPHLREKVITAVPNDHEQSRVEKIKVAKIVPQMQEEIL